MICENACKSRKNSFFVTVLLMGGKIVITFAFTAAIVAGDGSGVDSNCTSDVSPVSSNLETASKISL